MDALWIPSLSGALLCAVLLPMLMRAAPILGLLDYPDQRKRHHGPVPRVGGLAMLAGFAVALVVLALEHGELRWLLFACVMLGVVGTLDDRRNLGPWIRLPVQTAAVAAAFLGTGVLLQDVGALWSDDHLRLGAFAVPFTLFAAVGVINATNMADGLDGLAGGFVLIAVAAITVCALLAGDTDAAALTAALCACVLVFLVPNSSGRVFMGDVGSNFLGLTVAWLLVAHSQGENAIVPPVSALWLYAVPLMDAVGVMLLRVARGRSPLRADRLHFHYLLVTAGFSKRTAVRVLHACAILAATVGVVTALTGVSQPALFAAFMTLFALTLVLRWRVPDPITTEITECGAISDPYASPSLEPAASRPVTAVSKLSPRNSAHASSTPVMSSMSMEKVQSTVMKPTAASAVSASRRRA